MSWLRSACVAIMVLSLGSQAAAEAETTEHQRLLAYLDSNFAAYLQRHPEVRTLIGVKEGNDQWNDYSMAFYDAEIQRGREALARLDEFDADALPADGRRQLSVAKHLVQAEIDHYPWRFHSYSVEQMRSVVDGSASLLINFHAVDTEADARAYIKRVAAYPVVVDDILAWTRKEAEMGVRPPKFVYPKVIENANGLIKGQPFDKAEDDSALLAAFRKKLAGSDLPPGQQEKLVSELNTALLDDFGPAIDKFTAALKELQAKTTAEHGVWKLPDGGAFYAHTIAHLTTENLAPEAVHQLGLDEVARIQTAMLALREPLGFEGDLKSFLDYMRLDEQWYFEESAAGREQYLEETQAAIDRIRPKMDEYFNLMPKADVILKRVEPYREKNTSAAFYNAPALDGSRPGIYYVPLYKMSDNSKWDMISTAYHEAIPGHHMQVAIAQELGNEPMMIKLAFFGSYVEGWALYAEQLAYEMGMYDGDPVGNFGRLASELFRAVRLVVDTGIHHKRWTREQAIDYMVNNTPMTRGYATGEIERYIVWPAQATSYKVGMIKILDLREQARQALGDRFDIRGFHDVVLGSGAVPLPVLEQMVGQWVHAQGSNP